MKVALVYDRVNKWGGAERVLLALKRIFPDAPLFTSVYNPTTSSWAKVFDVHTSFLGKFPIKKHELLAPLMPIAFENFSFDDYDLVISITSEAAKGIITKPSTKHICLCLTPTRYLWSGYTEYFTSSWFRFLASPFVSYLRAWDKAASARPDVFIAISSEVKKRIKEYYHRDSEVVYPALDDEFFEEVPFDKHAEKFFSSRKIVPKEYFLVVSRLSRFTAYKRVDHAIAAANKLKLPLVVAGDGDIEYFSSLAGSTVQFTGKITDSELRLLYINCKALIFPAKEDFGLVMAEVQACGRPVIAFGQGGSEDIVIPGETGVLYENQTVGELIDALKNFNEKDYNSFNCKKNAKRFAFSNFKEKFTAITKTV